MGREKPDSPTHTRLALTHPLPQFTHEPRKVGQDVVLMYTAFLYPFLFWGHIHPHTAEKKEGLLKNNYQYKARADERTRRCIMRKAVEET